MLDEMAKVEGSVLTSDVLGDPAIHAWATQVVKISAGAGDADPQNVRERRGGLSGGRTWRTGWPHARTGSGFMSPASDRARGSMPLDRATVEWPERLSAFVPVATLILPQQDVLARGQSEYGQGLSFNIWRVPEGERAGA